MNRVRSHTSSFITDDTTRQRCQVARNSRGLFSITPPVNRRPNASKSAQNHNQRSSRSRSAAAGSSSHPAVVLACFLLTCLLACSPACFGSALDPSAREDWADHMASLLNAEGELVTLIFPIVEKVRGKFNQVFFRNVLVLRACLPLWVLAFPSELAGPVDGVCLIFFQCDGHLLCLQSGYRGTSRGTSGIRWRIIYLAEKIFPVFEYLS